MGGFAETAGDKFEELDSMADEGDENKAQENVEAVLTKHKDVDTLVGIWAYNAHAIVKVVEKRNIRDKQTIVVFDAASLALSDMEKGKIDAMVVQNPYQMGYLTVKVLSGIATGKHERITEVFKGYDPKKKEFASQDDDIFNTELRVVVPDEKSPLKPDMFPDSKFFYYKDFKAWLDERGLVSS